ncbi:ROK family protein [Allorhizocola rhizosphaerae]|uniref:ROK family protein n=1 Tax=Allorhizocola rhizosphaerae TaxID=1872709 RepID=UPI001FEA72DC|nr:ROK family protein [Allorhizocola rhizosphaerae]
MSSGPLSTVCRDINFMVNTPPTGAAETGPPVDTAVSPVAVAGEHLQRGRHLTHRRMLALDIGGTKFAAAIVGDSGEMQERVEVPIGADPTATLSALVRSLASSPGLAGVGIGTAGPLDRGRVSPVNIPAWRGFPLADKVSELSGGLPVAIAGDAQCMALGEWWRGGHATPGHTMLGVVVSTGVGGGLVIDGTPFLGPTGNAGHIGHITVDPHGEPCPCGGVGCVETIASGPAMTRWALAHGWQPTSPTPDARMLAADARIGVPIAVAAFERAADALAIAFLTAAALCDIDRIVVGGGVSAAGETLLHPLRQTVKRRAGLAFLRRLQIEATSLGRDAGLYGAAALALTQA